MTPLNTIFLVSAPFLGWVLYFLTTFVLKRDRTNDNLSELVDKITAEFKNVIWLTRLIILFLILILIFGI